MRQLALGRAATGPYRRRLGRAARSPPPAAAPSLDGRRGRRRLRGDRGGRRRRLGGGAARGAGGALRARDGRRAALPARARRRRAAPGRARGSSPMRSPPPPACRPPPCAARMLAGDLRRSPRPRSPGGAAGLGRVPARGRAPRPADARQDRAVARGRARATGAAAVEWKLDGVRVQVHSDGDDVRVFTRTLDAVTERMPEIVEAVRALPVRTVILDGEAIACGPTGGRGRSRTP